MNAPLKVVWPLLIFVLLLSRICSGQQHPQPLPSVTDATGEKLKGLDESLNFIQHRLTKSISDLLWFQRLQEIAIVDKIRYVGPPPPPQNEVQRTITTNGVVIGAYTFLPRKPPRARKLPLIVLLHTEVHGDFNPEDDLRVTRELIEQGYAIIAPDYRGSTGYGGDFWRLIDYGGRENDDVFLARQWMLEHYANLDPRRVGIMGWSHGGAIALMNIFEHPEAYAVAYAGMPVTDLVFRLKQKEAPYRELFSVPYHIGKTIDQDPDEYLRRSPIFYADKLRTPLLLHAVANDEDVSPAEVDRLAQAFRQKGKQFQYKVYGNIDPGHAFNKLDTAEARASRLEIYKFFAQFLTPARPLR